MVIINRLFERGITYVGTDYLSHIIWDKYLLFEMEHGNYKGMAEIFQRLMKHPIRDLEKYYKQYF